MIKAHLEQVLAEQTKHKAQKREFRLLAELLAQQFHVRQGSHLVGLLGNGDEHNNVEAIAYWLAEKGEYIEDMKALQVDPLNHMHNELGKELINAEHGI